MGFFSLYDFSSEEEDEKEWEVRMTQKQMLQVSAS